MLSSNRTSPPLVTGISPKDGPPGTKVTIRGENLGYNHRDLIALRICGQDCLLSAEWQTPKRIICRTGKAKGTGDIIVVTKSGGVGSSLVQFRGYHIQIGPLQESAIWIDESQSYSAQYCKNRTSSTVLSTEYDNPLGISDEANETKYPEKKLKEYFPDGSGDTGSENFSAQWYLLENYHGTSFDDLKAGLNHLKRRSDERNERPKEFLKVHLPTFIDCFDALARMHRNMIATKENGKITEALEKLLQEANHGADKLFHDVLNRKDMADKTRNTLNVLQRFRFHFNLPLTVDRNIKKGDYDLVITDYIRGKSLFKDCQVAVFRKVNQEVENRIAEFRKMLYKKLMELPSTGEEQKKIIRYLEHLGSSGDPAWECLTNMHIWINNLLKSCKETHLAKDRESEAEKASRGSPPRVSSTGIAGDTENIKGKAPQKVLFLESLVRILSETLPELWKVGQSYLSSKLFKEVARPVDPKKHTQFKHMVFETIDLFSKLTRAALLPHTLENLPDRTSHGEWPGNSKNSPSGWVPLCVRYMRSGVAVLLPLELPQDSIDVLHELVFDMRVNCISTLLYQAMDDVKALFEKETWSVDADDDRGGITILPALFESIMSETLQHLQEVVLGRSGETELFVNAKIQEEIAQLVIQVFQTFAGVLEQLANPGVKDKCTSRLLPSPDGHGDATPSLDKRLIVMMSNCSHMRSYIVPRVVEMMSKYGYPKLAKIEAASSFCYQSLDERLFDHYIEAKASPITEHLYENMYSGGWDWKTCPPPVGVRMYMRDVFTGIVQVHSEAYSISPNFVPRVMRHLIENVTDEISRLFQSVPEFSENGAVQARLELVVLSNNLGYYKTSETQAAIQEALNCIPNISVDENRMVQDMLLDFQTQMKFYLMSFQVEKK